MKTAGILIASLLIFAVAGCSTIKIAMFRGFMAIMGDKVVESNFIALNDPEFISSGEADYLRDDEEVLGVSHNGVAKAYPLTMGFYHHIFNDTIGGRRMLVTFCPLTHTAMVFDPVIEGTQGLMFTVDGLKESNMIMVDDSTKSHWVQLTGEVIKGSMTGQRLKLLPGLHTTWGVWRDLHPETLVLSRDTGFEYDYSVYPWQEKYFKYKETSRFLFDISQRDDRYHPKEMMLGIEVNGTRRAYPFTEFGERCVIHDVIDGQPVVVFCDKNTETIAAFSRVFEGRTLTFCAEEGPGGICLTDSELNCSWDFEGRATGNTAEGGCLKPVTAFKAFWFAWFVFYPETEVYTETS